MNAESSRSHLILSVIIEATNKTNGQVNRGKVRFSSHQTHQNPVTAYLKTKIMLVG